MGAASTARDLRSQTYGIPPVTLSSNALVDLPEGEGSQWRALHPRRAGRHRPAISTARPVTSSETWTWLHSPVFRATPLDMKAEADLHFLQGVNQLIGHGWPYSPPEAGEPGWRFYAAAVFNDHNPWWLVMPDIALYLQRVSFLLRQGTAGERCRRVPADGRRVRRVHARPRFGQPGDGAADRPDRDSADPGRGLQLRFHRRCGASRKVGVPYRILVLPGVERIPLATLEKITKCGRDGDCDAAAPSLAPGLKEPETDTPKIRELARGCGWLRTRRSSARRCTRRSRRMWRSAPEIGFVHRKLAFAEIYFLANTSNHPVQSTAKFRVRGMQAASGTRSRARSHGRGNPLALDLAPYESRVRGVLEGARAGAARPRRVRADRPERRMEGDVPDGDREMNALHSWTESRPFFRAGDVREDCDAAATAKRRHLPEFRRRNAGGARRARAGTGMRAMLDGPVRDAAVVYVNGKRAGAVWCAPFEVM